MEPRPRPRSSEGIYGLGLDRGGSEELLEHAVVTRGVEEQARERKKITNFKLNKTGGEETERTREVRMDRERETLG